MHPKTRGWIVDIVLGGLIGGFLGAIVAVNVVIFSGIERGYQSGITEIFEYNAVLGVLVLSILVGGPVLGVVLARRARDIRMRRDT
jgi:MFS family permease